MRSNKRCTRGRTAGDWCITAIAAQYLSIRYTERLAEAGIESSVGTVGDSYDNALTETVIGLYKTELIHPRGPWRNADHVEFATLTWIDGSITVDCWNRSDISRLSSTRRRTTALRTLRPQRSDSRQSLQRSRGGSLRVSVASRDELSHENRPGDTNDVVPRSCRPRLIASLRHTRRGRQGVVGSASLDSAPG